MNCIYNLDGVGFTYESTQDSSTGEFKLGPLDFSIPADKISFILGRSGSGKSTLLSLLGLLRYPSDGSLLVDDQAISKETLTRKQMADYRLKNMGFALQKGELLPFLSLKENSDFILEYLGARIKKKETKNIFKTLYSSESRDGQLERLLVSKPTRLSQGQYQRGALARAVANRPKIILADEPTGNLDINTSHEAMIFLQDYKRKENEAGRQVSVIVVTHDVHLSIEYADRIFVLKKGMLETQLEKKEKNQWMDVNGPIPSDIYSHIVNHLK